MNKKVFISYSRKDSLDVAEFRSINTLREFEILIDDEEIEFNKPWKQNIRNKINDSSGAILFISKNALNPESPIRTLELPLIAKRYSDPEDNFNFFPIFLEDVDQKIINNYTFTPLGTKKAVNFLEYFQLYGEEQRNAIKGLSNRKRRWFYKTANKNFSHILEGGTLSPGETMLSKLIRKQRMRNLGIAFAVVISLFLFTRTDAFARVLIAAYQQVVGETVEENDNATVRFLAGQLNNIDNLNELGADEALLDSIEEVNELNLELDLNLTDSLTQNVEDFNASISEESTTTTTVAPTTTTTVAPTTTTTVAPTTTTTVAQSWSPPADTNNPITDGTYENICVVYGWNDCGNWKIYDASGNQVNNVVGPYPLSALQTLGCQNSGVNICGEEPIGYAVLSGRYYPIPQPSSDPQGTLVITNVVGETAEFTVSWTPSGSGVLGSALNGSASLRVTHSTGSSYTMDISANGETVTRDPNNSGFITVGNYTLTACIYHVWNGATYGNPLCSAPYSATGPLPTTTTTSTTTTTAGPTQGSNAGLDYIGWFVCSFDGVLYNAGINFDMVSGGTGYLQIQYDSGNGWYNGVQNFEISSGTSVYQGTGGISPNAQVQIRYRVSKYSGVHNGVSWSNPFISGVGEITNPIQMNSSNCS